VGDLSEHFNRSEFKCRHCGRVVVDPHLVRHLEALRALVRRPLRIVSGYRCSAYNAQVGGAPGSLHVQGMAADIERGYATADQALAAGFNGIGRTTRHDGQSWAVHVDVRTKRATWTYGA